MYFVFVCVFSYDHNFLLRTEFSNIPFCGRGKNDYGGKWLCEVRTIDPNKKAFSYSHFYLSVVVVGCGGEEGGGAVRRGETSLW